MRAGRGVAGVAGPSGWARPRNCTGGGSDETASRSGHRPQRPPPFSSAPPKCTVTVPSGPSAPSGPSSKADSAMRRWRAALAGHNSFVSPSRAACGAAALRRPHCQARTLGLSRVRKGWGRPTRATGQRPRDALRPSKNDIHTFSEGVSCETRPAFMPKHWEVRLAERRRWGVREGGQGAQKCCTRRDVICKRSLGSAPTAGACS